MKRKRSGRFLVFMGPMSQAKMLSCDVTLHGVTKINQRVLRDNEKRAFPWYMREVEK